MGNTVDRSVQIYLRTSVLLSPKAAPIYIPVNSVQRFPIIHTLVNPLSPLLFGDGHPNMCEMISHGGFG